MSENILKNSTVLITGGSGSWGNELTKQLLEKYDPKEIRIFSRGEHKQVEMKRKFQDKKLRFYIGDVRDKDRITQATQGVDCIFHLAALKHVPVCEENPYEAVLTNIIGTQNIINAAVRNNVKKVVDISTDKAVDPFNLYGVTKACGEKLVIAANLLSDKTRFVCVRGGNVLGTNGSVIPLFHEQILKLNGITITDPGMTRFLMRVEEAIELVLHAAVNSVGGEVFVMKTPACKITDLADVMIKRLGNNETEKKIIGIRPGEKLCEVLVSKYESPTTYDDSKFYVILPQIKINQTEKFYSNKGLPKISQSEFNSSNTTMLDMSEIESLLDKDGWLDVKRESGDLTYLQSLDKDLLKNFFKSEGWIK